jgi:methyl-accepting chemotaxis protein
MTSQPPRDQQFSGCGRHPSCSGEGKFSHLLGAVERNKVLLVFCLLALAAVVVDMKFVFDLNGEMTKAGNVRVGNPVSERLITVPVYAEVVGYVRYRMSVLLGVVILCFGSMIYLYVHKIHRPLKRLTQAAREMSSGNLSVPIRSNGSDEVGELAEVINDLAANYQEVLLLTGTAVGKSSSAVERIEEALDRGGQPAGQEELRGQVEAIKRDLEMLGSVVKDFEFYQTHFDGRKVVHAEKEPQGKKR